MAEDSVEEQRRREAARVSDHLQRRTKKQAETAPDGKATPPEFSRRPPAVGNLPLRTAMVKTDAAFTTGEPDGDPDPAVGEMDGDGETSTLTGSRMDTVTDPLSSEEMLTELEDRIGCFVTSISADSSSSSFTDGMSSRSQRPCKTERLRRAVTPVDGLIRPGVTVIFRPKSTMYPGDSVNQINSRRHEIAKGRWRLQYYKLALTALVPNFTDLPVEAKPKS